MLLHNCILHVNFKGTADESTRYHSSSSNSAWNALRSVLRSANGTAPWLQPYLVGEKEKTRKPAKRSSCSVARVLRQSALFVELCLRGIAQVYFQNNPISGLLILIGLLIQSTRVAVYGMVAVAIGNLTAYGLGFDRGLIRSGLFGYNAVLVGLLLATFDTVATTAADNNNAYSGWTFLAAIVMSAFSSIVFVTMGKLLVPYKSPPLTFPFNIATILFLLSTAQMRRVDYDGSSGRQPSLPSYIDSSTSGAATGSITGADFFAGVVRGVGQVYAADNLVSGVLILLGIAVCSRISAVAAFVGSAIGAATAVVVGAPAAHISSGLYGL